MPTSAAWRHQGARDGFEVVFFRDGDTGIHAEGTTAAVEEGAPFIVHYEIALDTQWRTRSARIVGSSSSGTRTTAIEADGSGHWRVNGEAVALLDGCLDLDLESSALTNAFPIHRLDLLPLQEAEAPAAYVRALDIEVARIEQWYRRLEDVDDGSRFDYASSTFDFRCELRYDATGLVLDYPGLATRKPAPPTS